MKKIINENPIKAEEISSRYHQSQLIKDTCRNCGADIYYSIRDISYRKKYYLCEKCRSSELFLIKEDTIKISDTTDLEKYRQSTLVEFNCIDCGCFYSKRISAIKKTGLRCRECSSKKTFKEKYGTDNPYLLKELQEKKKENIINKYGSLDSYQSQRLNQLKSNLMKTEGITNVFQREESKTKSKETKRKKYNNENFNNRDKAKETSLKKYGDENFNNRDKAKETMLNRYGVEYTMQSEELRKKVYRTNIDRYGGNSPFSSAITFRKSCETKLERYDNPHYTNTDQAYSTMIKRYGKWYSSTEECKEKVVNTCLAHFGVPYNFQSNETREKTKKTYLEKYGVDHNMKVPEIKKKVFSHSGMTAPEKKMDEFLRNRGFDYEYEFDCNGKNFDFAIFVNDELKILLEIDGEYWHGLVTDQFYGQTDHERFRKVPEDVFFIVCDSSRIEDCFEEVLHLFNIDYETWISEIIDSLPKLFPYIAYDEKRMINDYNKLINYKVNNTSFLAMSIVKHFHKSIYSARVGNKPSPTEAWQDKTLLDKCVRNRFIYSSSLSSQAIANGFSVCKLAPKVSVFNPSLAKRLINSYLSEYETIFDPFSGFSGRMLGACSLGKKYIGQDTNEDHVRESNEIINFLNLNAEVNAKDLFNSSGEFDCLFTCSPYGLKETWNNENQKNLSCDEWIDECLRRFECNSYLFVVDSTDKYKEFIVEELENKSHFGINTERVILIKGINNDYKHRAMFIYDY